MKTLIKQLSAAIILSAFVFGYSNANATELVNPANDYAESSLYMEDWMMDETLWNNTSFMLEILVTETESALEIENWMISDNFTTPGMVHEVEAEQKLSLENWMIDSEIWR